MNKPLIGFSTYLVEAYEFSKDKVRGRKDQDMIMSTMDYAVSVNEAGGIPLAIAPIADEAYLDEVIQKLDGLILTGGGDLDPIHYGASHKKHLGMIESARDYIEFILLKKALEKGIPVFGICRGLQLMNVYFGGSLVQDIPSEIETDILHSSLCASKWTGVHRVTISEDSLLSSCFEEDEIWVNSLHHQAVDKLGHGLRVSARSEDGLVEAIELVGDQLVFAVQWHPEMMAAKHFDQLALFRYFVERADLS